MVATRLRIRCPDGRAATTFGVSNARAGCVISAYAFGVVVGAPVLAVIGARFRRRVLLLAHTGREDARDVARAFVKALSSHGIVVRALADEAADLGLDPADLDIVAGADEDAACDCELAIVIGGDGTILRAAEITHERGTPLLGVNNRNLKTYDIDLGTTGRLIQALGDRRGSRLLVGESGIRTREDVQRLVAAGVDAVLIGETLMRRPDLGAAFQELFA